MREINVMSGLIANEVRKNINIRFNEYAIKKYGCTETELKNFYHKYNQAVDFYCDKEQKRTNRYGYLLGFSNMLFIPSLGCLLMQAANPTAMITLSGLSLGTMAISLAKLLANSKEEYHLNKKNPYIEEGTLYHDMAKDYSELKKQVLKKAK